MQDFRKLLIWQRAHALAVEIRACARTFPRSGYAEFKAQITRAADSIANNIVEGCGAATRKEFARFIDISIKSASEVEYQVQSARDNGLIGSRTWWSLTREVREIRRMLYGFRRTLLAADAADETKRDPPGMPLPRGRPRRKPGHKVEERPTVTRTAGETDSRLKTDD